MQVNIHRLTLFSFVFLPVVFLVLNEALSLESSPVLLPFGLTKRIRHHHPYTLLLPLHPPPSREAGLQGQLFHQHSEDSPSRLPARWPTND
jgi:hypothetical protein